MYCHDYVLTETACNYTLKRLIVWSTMSSWLEGGAGPLAVPLLVCLSGITAMFPMDFPGDSRVEWKEGMVKGEGSYLITPGYD